MMIPLLILLRFLFLALSVYRCYNDCIVSLTQCVRNAYLAPFEIVSKHFACYQDDVAYVMWITFATKFLPLLMTLLNRMNDGEYIWIFFVVRPNIRGKERILRTWKPKHSNESTNQMRYRSRNMNMNEYLRQKNPTKRCFKKFSIGFFSLHKALDLLSLTKRGYFNAMVIIFYDLARKLIPYINLALGKASPQS